MHARKRSINVVSSSVFCMFIKKEENLRLTVYKIEIVCAQLCAGYCTRWAQYFTRWDWLWYHHYQGRVQFVYCMLQS